MRREESLGLSMERRGGRGVCARIREGLLNKGRPCGTPPILNPFPASLESRLKLDRNQRILKTTERSHRDECFRAHGLGVCLVAGGPVC